MIYHCCWIIRNGEIPDPQIMTINVWNFKIDVSPYINEMLTFTTADFMHY